MSDLPVYNLKQIGEVRDALFHRVLYPRLCTVLAGPTFESFVADLSRELSSRIHTATLYETARQLLGHELTEGVARSFAARIAGNLHRLRANEVVLPWTGQAADEWVPVQVTRVDLARKKEDIGYNVTVVVLAGSCCPDKLIRFWKRGMYNVLAPRLGFTPRWGKRPFQDPAQFVSLRFMAKIDAAKSTTRPVFTEVGCAQSHLDWNLEVLKRRFKIIPCPNEFTHECHRCAVGVEECPAATHLKTYVVAVCQSCNTAQPFDPETAAGMCVSCTNKAVFARTT